MKCERCGWVGNEMSEAMMELIGGGCPRCFIADGMPRLDEELRRLGYDGPPRLDADGRY